MTETETETDSKANGRASSRSQTGWRESARPGQDVTAQLSGRRADKGRGGEGRRWDEREEPTMGEMVVIVSDRGGVVVSV